MCILLILTIHVRIPNLRLELNEHERAKMHRIDVLVQIEDAFRNASMENPYSPPQTSTQQAKSEAKNVSGNMTAFVFVAVGMLIGGGFAINELFGLYTPGPVLGIVGLFGGVGFFIGIAYLIASTISIWFTNRGKP